jgi:membrane-associated protein
VDLLASFIDIILHLDAHLLALTQQYGVWMYAILFLIIYSETGLIIMPFLPGDSLLFVAGALCGMGALQLEWLVPLLILAAFSGDNTNYWVGRLVGMRLLNRANARLIRPEHLAKARAFYEKHGGKTVILARCSARWAA